MKRLFAIGDVHGCYKTLYELVFNRIRPEKTDRLIMLGDYIDRGRMSREVIDLIMNLKEEGYDIVPLTGNHERMLLDSFDNPDNLPLWLMNDGQTTLESFGLDDISGLPEKYIDFFRSLNYFHREGNYLFVHAGFNDEAEDPFSDRESMIWESRFSYSNPVFANTRIIHGHRPKQLEYVRNMVSQNNQVIPIDTGCVYGSEMNRRYLSALEINTMEIISVEKMDE
ncbi:MAG: serine/threonine protein phosphatase [Bacteroidales bacterium]|nr:serine/threonine protein phosphatase [Bacteroidales bacterium]